MEENTNTSVRRGRLAARYRLLKRRMARALASRGKREGLIWQGALVLLLTTIIGGSYFMDKSGGLQPPGYAGGTEIAVAAPSGQQAADPEPVGAVEQPSTDTAELKPAEATPPEVSVPPPAVPSFRDERALQPVTETPAVAAAPATDEAVKPADAAVPSFRDQRPVVPSFRDTRPTSPASFRDERPIPPPEPPKAAEEQRPFEVGYFLEDRSPMVRQTETPAEVLIEPETKSTAATAPTVPAVSEPAAAAPASVPSPAAASGESLPTLVALAPGQLKIDPSAACTAPEVATEALDGGLMRMRITAGCHPNEFVQISYGGAEFIRKLNAYGTLDYTLDCFAGTSSGVEVRFADGATKSVPVAANDLDKVSKIAVIWRTGVDLDLHVFEYAAKFGQSGHLWAQAPSAMISARVQGQAHSRGHGFLSALDDDKSLGDKLEVYTFFHNDLQSAGSISLALDNATRGESPSGATCGQGALAEIDFQISILPRKGQAARQSGVLTRVECGTKLTQEARFNQSAMPGLRIRK